MTCPIRTATLLALRISGPAFLRGFDSAERFYVGTTDASASFGIGSRLGQPAHNLNNLLNLITIARLRSDVTSGRSSSVL